MSSYLSPTMTPVRVGRRWDAVECTRGTGTARPPYGGRLRIMFSGGLFSGRVFSGRKGGGGDELEVGGGAGAVEGGERTLVLASGLHVRAQRRHGAAGHA